MNGINRVWDMNSGSPDLTYEGLGPRLRKNELCAPYNCVDTVQVTMLRSTQPEFHGILLCPTPGMQAYRASGIPSKLNSFRRLNEKGGVAVVSPCTPLGSGSADYVVPRFSGK